MSILVELPLELYNANAFDAFRPVAEFNRGTARAMAWMSQLAYETAHPDKIAAVCESWKLRDPGIIKSARASLIPLIHTRGVMAEGRDATILAFAGTDPLVPANWFTNFDLSVTTSNVHRGFQEAVESIWQDLAEAIKTRRERTLILTGHSLGAALAAVTADRVLAELNLRVAAVYAFGMPRAGDSEFAQRYNDTLGATTYRLVHGDDIVASVPPPALRFRHVGRFLRCERGGKFADDAIPTAEFGDDPPFAPALAGGLHQGLMDLLALRPQPSFRDDLLGRLSGLLPPPIADHLPDRYCHALDTVGR